MAASWALVIAAADPGTAASQPLSVFALFTAVWSIYLFDRLYDARHLRSAEETPLRHRFAREHGTILRGFLALSTLLALASAPFLSRSVLAGGLALAGLTAAYYAGFRFGHRTRRGAVRGAGKEITIALVFTLGIFVSLAPLAPDLPNLLTGCALFLLFLGNCLRIAAAESRYDRKHDPAGFLPPTGAWIPRLPALLPLAALAISLYLISATPRSPVGSALLVTTALSFAVNRSTKIPAGWVQPLADLALFAPPLLLLAIRGIRV